MADEQNITKEEAQEEDSSLFNEPEKKESKFSWKRLLLTILFVIITAGLIGGGVWYMMDQQAREDKKASEKQIQKLQNQIDEIQKQSNNSELNQKSGKELSDTGYIEGTLTYPSGKIPDDLVVYAENIDSGAIYRETERTDTGYRIGAPNGNYYVYAIRSSDPSVKAYHNQFIVCGISVGCDDTTKIAVEIESGETTENIIVGDWWNL